MKSDFRALVFDLDGVLFDFNSAFAEKIKKIMPEFKLTEEMKDPQIWDWPREMGVSKETEDLVWENIRADKDFWAKIKPLIDKDIVEDIFNFSLVLPTYVVTSRPDGYVYSIVDATVRGMKNIGLPSLGVICAAEKGLLVEPLGIKYFIDDKPENVEEVARQIKRCNVEGSIVALLNANYNKKTKLTERIIRVESVREFLDIIYATFVEEVKDDSDNEGSDGESDD